MGPDGSELTLVACDPGTALPPGCSRTTLDSSFCCPKGHAVDDADVIGYCRRLCTNTLPSQCERRTEELRKGPCGAEYDAWFRCAASVPTCGDANTDCVEHVRAYLACSAEAEGLPCEVTTDTAYCTEATLNGVPQGIVALECTSKQDPSSGVFATCSPGSSTSSTSSGGLETVHKLCCEADLY